MINSCPIEILFSSMAFFFFNSSTEMAYFFDKEYSVSPFTTLCVFKFSVGSDFVDLMISEGFLTIGGCLLSVTFGADWLGALAP